MPWRTPREKTLKNREEYSGRAFLYCCQHSQDKKEREGEFKKYFPKLKPPVEALPAIFNLFNLGKSGAPRKALSKTLKTSRPLKGSPFPLEL